MKPKKKLSKTVYIKNKLKDKEIVDTSSESKKDADNLHTSNQSGKVVIKPLKNFSNQQMRDNVAESTSETEQPTISNEKSSLPTTNTSSPQASIQQQSQQVERELAQLKADKLADIEQEIAQLRKQKLDEIENEKQSIFETAQQEGFKLGQTEGQKEFTEKSKLLVQEIDNLLAHRQVLAEKSKKEILEIAVAAAEKMFYQQLTLEPEKREEIVMEVLKRITDMNHVVIKVAKEDLDYMRSIEDNIKKEMKNIKKLVIQIDPYQSPGGCVIETEMGYIDASINSFVSSIKAALFDVYDDLSEPGDEDKNATANASPGTSVSATEIPTQENNAPLAEDDDFDDELEEDGDELEDDDDFDDEPEEDDDELEDDDDFDDELEEDDDELEDDDDFDDELEEDDDEFEDDDDFDDFGDL